MEELTLAIGDIIVGIDIGTSKVSTFVGEVNNFNQIENIDYETERPFYRFFLDFAWPEKRLCIEIDGELHRYEKQQNNDNYYTYF